MEIAKNTVIQERVSDTQNKTRLSRLEKAKVRDILNKLKETERSKKIPTKAASSSRAKTDKKQKMVLKISSSIKE
jgi:hypothetical protein